MKATAPGKVILSGEHSVVYGAPAIATAVSDHIEAEFSPVTEGDELVVDSAATGRFSIPSDTLGALRARLDLHYQQFEQGARPVSSLLDAPAELLAYVLAQCCDRANGVLTTRSTLPTGSGMGSSAAVIAATLILAARLCERPMTQDERFRLVRHCERLQHGRGSAIDAAAVTYGGLIQVERDQVTRLDCHLGEGWYRVNSGRPGVSTGECVEAVRASYGNSGIWSEFAELTRALPTAFGNPQAVTALIRANHRLLCTIGVVPQPVQQFVAKVEAAGGAAKVSGAGAHRGSAGGLVLVYSPNASVDALCADAGYSHAPLIEAKQGAHEIED